jgi:aromatic-L-amino-acid decarboxylase
MDEKKSYHMSPADFESNGRELLKWLKEYHQRIESFPVMSQVQPGQIRASLPDKPPQRGELFQEMLADIEKVILPGITHWQSPNFFAFFPANTSGPAILGELLSAGLGVQGMIWATSPACTELETHVLDWLVEMLDLPQKFKSSEAGGGVIQDTASSASLCAILAAREKITNFMFNKRGGDGRLVAYTSSQAHSSVEKGIKIAGIGQDNLRLIEVDSNFAMRPDLLAEQINKDIKDGKKPFFVCATVGTTSSNAIDPLEDIGKICQQHQIWLHVDAAMSGTAAICPEYRFIHKGLEFADSYCFNPHKWMFTTFDCDCFFVADRKILINTLSILPEYLRNKASESGIVIDYRDWHIPLGRRFRALKLWFVIRHYGVEGLRYHIRQHIAAAQDFARWIDNDDNWELITPVPLNLVCFRHKAGDEFNALLLNKLNQSGKLYITHTKLNGCYVLRFCVAQTNTEQHHVEQAWNLMREMADGLISHTT